MQIFYLVRILFCCTDWLVLGPADLLPVAARLDLDQFVPAKSTVVQYISAVTVMKVKYLEEQQGIYLSLSIYYSVFTKFAWM